MPPAGTYASSGLAPAPSLPVGWVNTGEFVSDLASQGNDGLVNGKMVVPVLAANDAKVQNNFGIERAPESVDKSTSIIYPPAGSLVCINGANLNPNGTPNPLPVLEGSDPEDQPVSGTLSTRTVKFSSLPTNSRLEYAGVPVVANQIITNFNPSLLKIRFVNAPPNLAGSTQFQYAFVDAAGVVDSSPATYVISWPPLSTVPVTLESFSASKSNCVATLNWKTTSELNTDKFEIEMSTLTGNNYTKVGTVPAKGSISTASNYQTLFPMESGTVYYFRLKIINSDGSYTYSAIQIVSCIERKEITIKPNPTIDIFKISNMEAGKNVVSILAADSKLIQQFEFSVTSADISLATYAKGVYIVKIQNENGSIEVKRIVKN